MPRLVVPRSVRAIVLDRPSFANVQWVLRSGTLRTDELRLAFRRAAQKGGWKQERQHGSSGSPQLFVTRFNLSPGASLTRLVEGQEALIFGMGDGELVNEKKSPPAHVNVRNGSMVLMPREEYYLLRNIGKQELDVLVVQVRR